ncbi:MAG: PP2C family serine/threonine-protein phosphatase [Planctomycetota bacterium]
MTIKHDHFRWRAIGATTCGASHLRTGRPNQDAIAWLPETGKGPPLVMLVADGHGADKSFRSGTGSRLAVEIGKQILLAFADSQRQSMNLSALKRLAEEKLPIDVGRAWRKAVSLNLKSNPFSSAELDELERKGGASARQAVLKRPHSAYGTTLLAVLVTEAFQLYLQLGDGDIVTVSETGETSRPLPPDPASFGNETNSLAGENALREFRVCFRVHNVMPPALTLLATDGYCNSFIDDEAFLAAGPDILQQIRSDGLSSVQERLPEWIAAVTRQGSGDDITVGIIKRGEDTDRDSVLQRLSACEAGLDTALQQEMRVAALEELAAGNRRDLALVQVEVQQVAHRFRRYQCSMAIAAIAILLVLLVLILWLPEVPFRAPRSRPLSGNTAGFVQTDSVKAECR